VRRHAKAPSAGSTSGRGRGLGSTVCGAIAGRGASSGADGSGALSLGRAGLSALALTIVALALLTLAPLSQAKVVVSGFGISPPTSDFDLGGQFSVFIGETAPRGVAINTSGNGAPAGTSYVVDGFGNRLERFGPTGVFQRLWGQDVIAPSVNEAQQLTVNASGGTFTLSFNGFTTNPVEVDSNPLSEAEHINTALAALPSVNGTANVSVSADVNLPGVAIVTFKGALGFANQPQLTADTSQLTGSLRISTAVDGHAVPEDTGTGFEICTIAADCKVGSTSGTTANGGQLSNARGVAVNQTNGDVYVTESANRRIQEFDPDGNFIRAFGWDVIASGQPNDNGTGYEVCDTTAAVPDAITDCKRGAAGANGGEFGEEGIGFPVTDPSGDVWVPDSGNKRIQEFSSSGNFIAAYGYDVDKLGGSGALETCTSLVANACGAGTAGSLPGQFASSGPTQIALDSAGNLYAIDSGNHRVQEINPATPSVVTSTFAASLFSAYTATAPAQITSSQGGTRLDFALANTVSGGGEAEILELDPTNPAAPTDTSLVGSGFLYRTYNGTVQNSSATSGLAADAAGNLYLTTASFASPRRVLVLSATPNSAPALTVNPIGTKTDAAADFSGTVNPRGGLVGSCKFQYSTDQLSWTDVPEPDCDSLSLSGIQTVSEHVTGLTPNTHYYVRLSAARPLVPGSTVTTGVQPFDTDSVPPVLSDVGAIQVQDTSARLVGTIDPRNSDTAYHFEYGTTPDLGSSTTSVSIGGGTTPLVVSQLVPGLAKDTTYYFRLLATNAFGSTPSSEQTFHTRATPLPAVTQDCPNEAVRQAQGSTFLPDCRAYELVSPPDKNAGEVQQGAGSQAASFSSDGNAAAFCTGAIFGQPPGEMPAVCASYLSRRTATGPTGWQTTNPFPPVCRNSVDTGANEGAQNIWLPADFGSFPAAVLEQSELDGCPFGPLDPSAPAPAMNVYRQDLGADPSTFSLLPTDSQPGNTSAPSIDFRGASEDLRHIVYSAELNQTPDSPPQEDFSKLYSWDDGATSLVSVDPAGNPFTVSADIPLAGAGYSYLNQSAVSQNGERVYFQAAASPGGSASPGGGCDPGPGCELYLRDQGVGQTFRVSAPECSGSCGPSHSPTAFLSATPAGDKAFFLSCDQLTDASTPFETSVSPACAGAVTDQSEQAKLYRWSEDPDASGHHLTDLTSDHEPSDGLRPRAKALIGASADGDTAYFVAHGQIVSGQPTGDFLKLYRWRWNGGTPVVDYLGPYISSFGFRGRFLSALGADNITTSSLAYDDNLSGHRVQVTPDGRYLLITSRERYQPAVDHDANVDLYRWDAQNGWLCISCPPPGTPSRGDAIWGSLYASIDGVPLRGEYQLDSAISSDGKRIVFTTPNALVPQDTDGENGCPAHVTGNQSIPISYSCDDIYEWSDGAINLLTPGSGPDRPELMGTTPDGNVFFETRQRLVGWDTDNSTDIYTARVGGGFPEPPPTGVPCEGEGCRGQSPGAPGSIGAGTAAFEGPANPTPEHRKGKAHKHKKHRKHTRHRRANHNRRAPR